MSTGNLSAAYAATQRSSFATRPVEVLLRRVLNDCVAIFYPFSQFYEITISLLSLQKQPKTASKVFQRGVEYGKGG